MDQFWGARSESIHINATDAAALEQLQQYFAEHGDIFGETNITYTVGDALDLSQYFDPTTENADFNLNDALEKLQQKGIGTISLNGGHSSKVTIDDLLDDQQAGLTINGDGDDQIFLTGGWVQNGSANDQGYISYTNETGQELHIYQEIVVQFGG